MAKILCRHRGHVHDAAPVVAQGRIDEEAGGNTFARFEDPCPPSQKLDRGGKSRLASFIVMATVAGTAPAFLTTVPIQGCVEILGQGMSG